MDKRIEGPMCDCGRPVHPKDAEGRRNGPRGTRGRCSACYARWLKSDTFVPIPKATFENVAARAAAIEPDANGCRDSRGMWTGNTGGYPQVRINGRLTLVSRIVLTVKLGRDLAPGMEACHRCDRPWCISDKCLFEGTHRDNMRDEIEKGRDPDRRGEANNKAKLTEDQVREIRASTDRGVDLAARYGVSMAQVSSIRLRRTWKHLD